MNRIDHRLTLDVTKPGSQGRVYIRAGDTNAHRLYVYLRMGAEEFALTSNMVAMARARPANGTAVTEYGVQISDGAAVWDLPAAFSTMECELYVWLSASSHFVSPRFEIVADEVIGGVG